MRWAMYPLAGLLAAALSGCPEPSEPDIEIYSITGAPVGRTARVHNVVDPPAHDIQITRGVAVAVGCWDSCDYTCQAPTLTSADDSVVRVRQLYRAASSATQFVLVAVAPGTTEVTVETGCARRSYPVSVLDQ
jgi:hypothetical protein